MTSLRVLHVDDEPDIREVVELSLGLDPDFTVRSCASGEAALAAASSWAPDLILLDVMMPVMDGPSTLSELRMNPETADIPIVFMTARAQPRELEHFVSLGAEGVITKPFDPMTLAATVRKYAGGLAADIAARRQNFIDRARGYRGVLSRLSADLEKSDTAAALDDILTIAHNIAGAAGIFGFAAMSRDALALEAATKAGLDGTGGLEDIQRNIRHVIEGIDRA